MAQSDTAISRRVTKPRLFDEAIHFRARKGTKSRIDALRGKTRQGDFIRLLIEEALAVHEDGEQSKPVSETTGQRPITK